MTPSPLALTDVSVVAGGRRILDRIDLTVGPAERVAITGPSGSGKSLVVRVAIGLTQPSGGEVRLAGIVLGERNVAASRAARATIGIVAQGGSLLSTLSVEDNLRLGLGPVRVAAAERFTRRLDRVLLQFGIEHLAGRRVSLLAAGEQRQVELARAALRDPSLLILDEPLAGAHAIADRLEAEIRRRTVGRGCALLLLTQDTTLAGRLASRMLRLEAGRLVAQQPGGGEVPPASP